jgi:hypothetical protein
MSSVKLHLPLPTWIIIPAPMSYLSLFAAVISIGPSRRRASVV